MATLKKFLVGNHIYGPLVIEEPVSASPKRRFHISDSVDFLSYKDPRGPRLMDIVRKHAVATGVRVISEQGHRFDIVPGNPEDLSIKSIDAFTRRLRANEAQLTAALVKKG